jgi:hypothetical protein
MNMTVRSAEQLEIHSVNCRNLLPNILRGQIAGGFIMTAPVMIIFAALTVTTPAFAQSALDSSSAPATDYALPPPRGSLIQPAMPEDPTTEDATPDEETRSDATSSAAVPTEPSAAVKNRITAADHYSTSGEEHSAWDRVGDLGDNSDDDDQADNVLEVPQALPSTDPQPSVDSDQTAQEDGSQSPDDQDPTPDQVGSIEDYDDDEDGALMGAYGVPVLIAPVGINPFGVSAFHAPMYSQRGFAQGFQHGFVPIVPRQFGGTNSAILPTSPMFPGGSARFSGGMPFSRGMGFSGGMRGGHR